MIASIFFTGGLVSSELAAIIAMRLGKAPPVDAALRQKAPTWPNLCRNFSAVG
jgi:hypothetical protein